MNISPRRLLYLVYAFISASAIIGSTIIMPVNTLADAEPIAETVLEQPVDTTVTTQPETNTEPLTIITTEASDPTPLIVESSPTPQVQQDQPDATLTNDASISTDTTQNTTSGDITASNNEAIGNSTTGQADSTVFIVNDATNITSLDGGTISLLTGPTDTSTDIIINPQVASNSQASTPVLVDGVVIIDNTIDIANIVVVDSTSGSATIVNNEDVGNTATGDAISDVSILNMANNIVAAGDVFVGVITVRGDFSDNIVLSQALIDYLINGTMSTPSLFSTNVDIANLQVLTNSVNAAATSGAIDITRNEDIGSAKTGDAQTFVLIKNFNGSFVLYGNSLLFIVNVMGDWNGGILGVQNNGVATLSADGSGLIMTSPISTSLTGNESLTIRNSTTVTNTVSATAKTGDISLQDNEDVGNATTGNASVHVRILNVLNTIVSFGNRLGVIFINIFGDWNGGVVMQQSSPDNAEPITPVDTFTYPSPLSSTANIPSYSGMRQFFRSLGNSTPVNDIAPEDTTIVAAVNNDAMPNIIKISVDDSRSYLWIAIIAIVSGGMLAGNRIYVLRQ